MRQLLTAGLMALLLSACGFHLRRPPDLPPSMRKIFIAAPGSHGDLLRGLRRDLSSDDTEVLPTPDGATTVLSILNVGQTSRPLVLNRAGVALLYQVEYQVEFSLTVQGAVILEPQTVILNRNYTYRVSNAIANEEQEQALNEALSRDVARFIATRVVAAAKSLPNYLKDVPSAATHAAPSAASRPVPAAATSAAPEPHTGNVPGAATAAPPV